MLSTQRDASRNRRRMDLSIFNVRIWPTVLKVDFQISAQESFVSLCARIPRSQWTTEGRRIIGQQHNSFLSWQHFKAFKILNSNWPFRSSFLLLADICTDFAASVLMGLKTPPTAYNQEQHPAQTIWTLKKNQPPNSTGCILVAKFLPNGKNLFSACTAIGRLFILWKMVKWNSPSIWSASNPPRSEH